MSLPYYSHNNKTQSVILNNNVFAIDDNHKIHIFSLN